MGATIYYRWEGGHEQRYKAPIQLPDTGPNRRILHFWAQDAAGNREPPQQEYYVHEPEVPQVDVLALSTARLGVHDAVMLRWRSVAANATYEIAVTSGDWGPGKSLAHGVVTPDVVQQNTIAGTALFPGENRLWLRLRDAKGAVAAASRLLSVYATPALTRAWPPGGVFGTAQTVALITTRAATIYYTIDGSEPTLASPRYTQPLTIDRSTTLRFFSLDPYGNQETPRQERFVIQSRAATITFSTLVNHTVNNETPFALSWRSDKTGRYAVSLQNSQEHRQVMVQQGMVQRQQEMRTGIAQNFLTPGVWQVQLRVQPNEGQAGFIAFTIHAFHRETFATTRYLNTETTTATWDTAQHQVRLSQGPRLLGTYRTRDHSQQVTVHGTYAYLANGQGGLHIVDVSDASQPRQTGVFYPHGKAAALAKYDRYVYLAASESGIAILDVSDPQAPTLVAILPVAGSASDITIEGPVAYVGTQQGTLTIYDLTTPLQPLQLGQVDVGGRIVDMAVQAGMVYLACLHQGLVMVDAQTPQQPRVSHRWTVGGAATGVAVRASQVVVASGALDVVDTSHPEAPVRTYRRLQSTYGLALLPPYAVVAAGTDGVQLLSIDGRGSIIHSPTAHYAARLTLQGALALVADTRGGLRLLDLSQPDHPQFLAAVENIGTIVDVIIDGSIAYLAKDDQGSGLVVVDVSDPTAPRVLGQYHTESTTDVVVWNDMALLSDAAGVLQGVDVHQPGRPQLRGTLALPGTPERLALLPPYVLVASDSAGVYVVEVTSAGGLHLRASLPLPGRALDLALVDHTAYVAAVEGGIQVVDVSTPEQPQVEIPYHHADGEGDHILRLTGHQNLLYAIDNQRGVQVLSRSTEGQWQLESSVTVPRGAPWGLTAVGPYLFVTTVLHSLYVMDMSIPSQPRLRSTVPGGGSAIAASDGVLYIAVRGKRGVPGGLRLVEAFTPIPEHALPPLQAQHVVTLPGPTPGTRLANRADIFQSPGVVESTVLSPPDISVRTVRLLVRDFWGTSGHIDYALSNDGGLHWHPVQPGVWYHFATAGSELRWRATLTSTNVVMTPYLDIIRIEYPEPEGNQW
jgi:hypothetical protein